MENNHDQKNSNKSVSMPLIFAAILIAGIFIGYITNHKLSEKPSLFSGREQNRVEEVLNYIDEKYIDSIDRETLMDDMIEDIMSKLDPHSFYVPVDDTKEMAEQIEGKFEGIGIEFNIVKDTILIISTITDGPSEILGIQAGDKIVMINDTLVAGNGIENQEVIKKLKGQKGTRVKISVERNGHKQLIDFDITRDEVKIFGVDVAYMVDKEIGYIRINRFSEDIYPEFMEAMDKLSSSGMKKLILDMSGNPGGLLEPSTFIADEFLDGDKLIVYTEGKAYERKDYNAKKPGVFEEGELVILIDQYSASASEILAGAIQDWDRGLIIGRRSFGKGLVQQEYELNDGSVLRLTIARYYTPTGRSIQKPYSNGLELYDEEVLSRFDHGELFENDSSLMVDSMKYTTPGGRTVYGGGGIMPDIFVPVDTTMNIELSGLIRALAPEFTYNYFSHHTDEFDGFKNFDDFLKNYSVSETMLSSFRKLVEKDHPDFEDREYIELNDYAKKTIKAHIGRQLWKNEGYYPIINSIDPVFLRAVEELRK